MGGLALSNTHFTYRSAAKQLGIYVSAHTTQHFQMPSNQPVQAGLPSIEASRR
jgi:hypothetical protein